MINFIKNYLKRQKEVKKIRRYFPNLHEDIINLYLKNPKWAACPTLLNILLKINLKVKPKNIVEFGSGITTLVLAKSIPKQSKLVSFDESNIFLDKTKKIISNDNLNIEYTYPDNKGIRYDKTPLYHCDLLIIDGPKGDRFSPEALKSFKKIINQDTICVIDDTDRSYDNEQSSTIAKQNNLVKKDYWCLYAKKQKFSVLFPQSLKEELELFNIYE